MSLDASLKTSGALTKHRNVLSRQERIAKLTSGGSFDPASDSPTGLPKVASRKVATKKTAKKEEKATEGS
jgi:small basic protein (TIGR04137 family)